MGVKDEAIRITEIDKDNLDLECIRLPSSYRQFAFLAAEAKRDVQEAKAQLDVVQAELAKQIRATPGKYGVEKLTETALQGIVITQKRYKEAQAYLFKCQHRAEMCSATVWALEHKKRALTLLVDLHGMGYFAEVKMNRDGKEAVENMTRRKIRKRNAD